MIEEQMSKREVELRAVYDKTVKPLIEERKYKEAFFLLSQHKELRYVMTSSELRIAYNAAESLYFNLLDNISKEIYGSNKETRLELNKLEREVEEIKSLDLVSGEEIK
jgi:hypothetical protein